MTLAKLLGDHSTGETHTVVLWRIPRVGTKSGHGQASLLLRQCSDEGLKTGPHLPPSRQDGPLVTISTLIRASLLWACEVKAPGTAEVGIHNTQQQDRNPLSKEAVPPLQSTS